MTDNYDNAFGMRDEELHCPECGHTERSVRIETESFDYGSGDEAVRLEACIPIYTCDHCGLQYTSSNAEDIRHNAVCAHLGVMTPQQIRELRELLGSRQEFARLTKLGEATIARWERGALIQNTAYDQYLYLLSFADNVQRLSQRNTVPPSRPAAHAADLRQRFRHLDDPDKADAQGQCFRLVVGG